ncbi:MAG: thiol reductase thioredoxin [bacterium]|nr:thiol reductase thioredoxin [bacterium]
MNISLRCPACGSSNTIRENNSKTPICKKCRIPIITGQSAKPIQLTDIDFDNYIRNAHRPVLVDFWAGWCAPCRSLGPILENFSLYQRSIEVAKLDTERNPLTTSQFQVFSIPTMILFVKGIEVKRIKGARSLPALEIELAPWIAFN